MVAGLILAVSQRFQNIAKISFNRLLLGHSPGHPSVSSLQYPDIGYQAGIRTHTHWRDTQIKYLQTKTGSGQEQFTLSQQLVDTDYLKMTPRPLVGAGEISWV